MGYSQKELLWRRGSRRSPQCGSAPAGEHRSRGGRRDRIPDGGTAKIARKVIALDFSEAMMSQARAKLGQGNIEFKIGNVKQIPLPNASVDAVIGNMVLHHCPSPEAAVREMARALVPGGRLVLSDLQAHSYESLRKEHADLWMGFKMDYVRMTLQKSALEGVSVEGLSSCCSETKENEHIMIPMFLAAGHKPF